MTTGLGVDPQCTLGLPNWPLPIPGADVDSIQPVWASAATSDSRSTGTAGSAKQIAGFVQVPKSKVAALFSGSLHQVGQLLETEDDGRVSNGQGQFSNNDRPILDHLSVELTIGYRAQAGLLLLPDRRQDFLILNCPESWRLPLGFTRKDGAGTVQWQKERIWLRGIFDNPWPVIVGVVSLICGILGVWGDAAE